ncbi:hypothetical protein MYCTH_93589 [Thermothelomyces thermophilus ATCC 42464]|uniref:Rhodopsin domain-containing protein n=1 Tax=Thermothelomyces thermophilus (strain ATCC 42464 / BCRC 31852 / DSM 1799) TaxID=573729 RepID=G2QD12_THET4|nr:uncharacterized protein MYCTH_93589 [Thermothelomyces thermophilus ATCC 42464]AEO58230.1 hypothetical protein MYCTH_93589 [Thermothelomyces thermophilus ATCC 42464]
MAPPPPSSPPPPMVDEGYRAGDRLVVHALAPVGTLLGIACITTGLRIYWRLQPSQRIGADDYTLLFALTADLGPARSQFVTIAWYGIDAAMYHHGRGLEGFGPDPWTMGPLIVAGGVLWVWGINVIRISVALMLLRFRDSRSLPWTMTVWAVIGVQTCMLAVGTIMHLVMCRPISARWAPTPSANCIKPTHFMTYGYLYSGFTIASDLIPSLLPITFIRTLSRPLHEKMLIGCLMAARTAATGVAVARLLLVVGYLGPGGPVINVEQDILWGLELTIGVLAASVPSLKAPTHRILRSWGLLRSRSTSDMSFQSFLDRLPNGSHVSRRMGPWQYAVPDQDPRTEGGSGEEMLKGSEALQVPGIRRCRKARLVTGYKMGYFAYNISCSLS